MNKKGFTLIELLAVIVVLGVVLLLAMPSILDSINASRDSSYKILIGNIKTAAETYYQECEYGDLSDKNKYGSYACSIDASSITIPLSSLANTGFLKVSDTKKVAGKEVKVVLNPKNNADMSDCQIKITKVKETNTDENNIENIKVTYKVEPISGSDCPTKKDYEGAQNEFSRKQMG